RGASMDPPSIVLIYVDAHVQELRVAEQHEWRGQHAALRELAEPRFNLQDAAGYRGTDGAALDLDLHLLDLCLGQCECCFIDGHIKATVRQIHGTYRASNSQALGDLEQIVCLR